MARDTGEGKPDRITRYTNSPADQFRAEMDDSNIGLGICHKSKQVVLVADRPCSYMPPRIARIVGEELLKLAEEVEKLTNGG